MKAKLENGIVKKYKLLPTRYSIGSTLINLETASEYIQQSEGFFEVQEIVPTQYQSIKPLVAGDLINDVWIEKVRDWTQIEIDNFIAAETEELVLFQLVTEIQDGLEAANKLKVFLKTQLDVSQYKQARITVRPVWEALKEGDWDIALDEITLIDNANSTPVSRKIKTHIEAYLV